MDRGLSFLFRLMRASWVFIGNSVFEKKERYPEEFDQEEERIFSEEGE